jgi:mycothiol synthase
MTIGGNILSHFTQLENTGYEVRPARMDDLPAVVPMFNAAEAALHGAGDYTVERYTQEWQQTGIDLVQSTRIVLAPEGNVVGCVELWDQFNPPARPWIWGRVHPNWEGRGIGSAMLEWALDTSRRALERLPEDARLAPHVAAPASHRPSIELFESLGMHCQRVTWNMIRDLDGELAEPVLPPGYEIRTLRYPDELEAVYRAQDEAFSEHWGYVKRPFEEGFRFWKEMAFTAQRLKPELFYLAMRGEEIAGLANAQERSDLDAGKGWIPALAVRKPHRRHGLGQALLLTAFHALQARGVPRVGLSVDSENRSGATRLYERVGMRVELEMLSYEIELRPGRELAVMD